MSFFFEVSFSLLEEDLVACHDRTYFGAGNHRIQPCVTEMDDTEHNEM